MKSIVTRMLGKCLQRRNDSGVTRRSWPASLTPMVRWLTHYAWFSFIRWINAIPIFYAILMLTSFSLMESVHLWTPSRHCPTIGRTSCSVCADFRIKFCNIWNVRLLFPWLIAKCSNYLYHSDSLLVHVLQGLEHRGHHPAVELTLQRNNIFNLSTTSAKIWRTMRGPPVTTSRTQIQYERATFTLFDTQLPSHMTKYIPNLAPAVALTEISTIV